MLILDKEISCFVITNYWCLYNFNELRRLDIVNIHGKVDYVAFSRYDDKMPKQIHVFSKPTIIKIC